MNRILAVVGPTAVGKTDIAIELAERLGAEIVGCDSMQVYRGMAVLTQQPTRAQRARVSHHVVDCIEPEEMFNAGRYRAMALEAIAQIQRRGRAVVLTGGTGLYLKALTDGLCEAPPADVRIREALWAQVEAGGAEVLYARLHDVDPEAAEKIHPRNARRVVRALEVYELTGQPLSRGWAWGRGSAVQDGAGSSLNMTVVGLLRDRQELYARINQRVERMIREDGVLEEVRQLMPRAISRTARQVHGLAFLESFLNGGASREEMIPLWQQQVRRYAKRQLTWFRAQSQIRWVTLGSEESNETIVARILGSAQ